MEDQSPYVSSSNAGRHSPQPEEQPHRGAEQPKPWEDLDVLDLTGGQYSHPAFSVSFPVNPPVKEEDEEEDKQRSYSDSLEPSPEEEEPSSIGSDVPRAQVIPSAPVEEHDTAAAPYSSPSSGSLDVNLFPLSAASAPLMHSSADNIMDFQQPSRIEPAGKEDFSSVLLESTASLPSLSSGYTKGPSATVAFSADSASPSALQGYDTETDYTESKLHKFTSGLGEINEDTIFSERGFTVQHPTSEPDSVPAEHAKLYTQSAKEMFSGMLKSVGPPHEEFTDLKEGVDEHYVDFKPFASTKVHDFGFEVKDAPPDFKSDISHLIFESEKPSEIYSEEKDIDLSDDISPASPEAISDYETFPALQQAAPSAYGGNPFTDHKFEEKRLEQVETRPTSHLGSKVATVNPFLEHMDRQMDYVSTDSMSGIVAAQVSSKSEGLTPDIVQEAYESEIHEVGVPKLNYEPKIDLVQTTTKATQENVSPVAQNTTLFEDSDSISSPVLPDIVMEAPLTSAPVGLNAIAPQPDVSPVGQRKLDSEEKIKSDSEKPPSYDDAVKKASFQEKQQPVVVCVEQVKRAPAEETEAPYISIACDLIKETIPEKVTDFSKALASEFDSQYAANYDESSPESEPSEPSYKHWESEVISKVAPPAVGSLKSHDVTLEKEKESDLKWKEQVPSKGYLESEATISDVSLAKEPVTQLSNQEKPLQMEAFGKIYSEEVPQVKQPVHFEKSSAVPPIDEFVFKPSRDDRAEVKETKPLYDVQKQEPKKTEEAHKQQKAKESDHASDKLLDLSKAGTVFEETVSKPKPPAKSAEITNSTTTEKKQPSAPLCLGVCSFKTSVVDLLYWRDIKKSGAVFGASLFLLLSLTVFSIVSVSAYIALALLSVSISFRIYKGVLQAIQKSDDGHPFKQLLDTDVSVSEDLVKKYCNLALGHINCSVKELRRLFLVEDLVDSLKFAVLMWVFTYIGALFNGLTLLILALISLFSIPVVYERHQTKVDHYLGLISKNVNNIKELILSKVPGLKRKAE